MLRFASKPDKVFTEIISNALSLAIYHFENDIETNNSNGFAFIYFDEKFVNSFGGVKDGIPIILNEIKKIKQAHNSSEIYMPTDIHFKMLDRILLTYCALYTEELHRHEKFTIKCNGEILKKLAYDEILDFFFWDTDYDLDETIASALLFNKQLREQVDPSISIQALNTASGKPVDFSDLKMEKWDEPEPDWTDLVDYSDLWLNKDIDEESF